MSPSRRDDLRHRSSWLSSSSSRSPSPTQRPVPPPIDIRVVAPSQRDVFGERSVPSARTSSSSSSSAAVAKNRVGAKRPATLRPLPSLPSAFSGHTSRRAPYHALVLDAVEYDRVVRRARSFFADILGFVEVPTQNRLSLLAACEDPKNVVMYDDGGDDCTGERWPLPQTGQMWLANELLRNRHVDGFYCLTTSYRTEPDTKAGRHLSISPMIEFETRGTEADLIELLTDFCVHMGVLTKHIGARSYDDVVERCSRSGDVDPAAQAALYAEHGLAAAFVTRFPERVHPLWNIKRTADGGHAHKIDVVMGGHKTIAGAERSTNKRQMLKSFYTTRNGDYARVLFKLFTRKRVEAELADLLAFDMFPRIGGAIDVARLIQAMARFEHDGYLARGVVGARTQDEFLL